MSETVHYKGKIKKLERPQGLDLNSHAKQLCEQLNIKENKYWIEYGDGNYVDLLTEDGESHILVDNELYEVLSQKNHDIDEDIYILNKNEDGTLNYEVRYYNGCSSFREAIKECFNELKQ